ncbi:acetyl/propionyl/methylcrotonyl-CoA carboxylase subunit alpha [Pseudomonas sp. RIT-PI-AD]|uniref:acetyl/propionyl/methylcrotonyl-CoA carboxylase subunit alpha n=1 Tax=Pseudomonas sp. RIT-PI-AD TaxID=3035294 RepID=UPI0021D7DE4E|nr:acetyl/propionyl/methylcrotonyl-CoA carboxylase subunit alpha [Pseudomonas sp. RIT-PI-AD]
MPAFDKILVANRGEIACRILRTAHALGYRTVAVYSEADAGARHVQMADEAVCLGPAAAAQSYLNIDALLEAARRTGAEAVHPGYGFLSENAGFAQACEAAGLVFIGPDVEAIRLMGSKRLAKAAMLAAGVPCIPGYQGAEQDDACLAREAARIGYPLMIKASAGGGGRGMRLVESAAALPESLHGARSEARNAFGSDELILEKALTTARHVEVQVFGDRHGNRVHLGERDCSVQRRHQKVIEEAPCPVLSAEQRQAMGAAAVKAAASVGYVGAGTVEFLLDEDGAFYFLEMNTRLQVEHPVTEAITGQDLVAWQLRVAEGLPLPLRQEHIRFEGHAIEVRLYAEDSRRDFLPQTGLVHRWEPAVVEGVRIDHGLREGQPVTAFYDPLLAKLVAHGATRDEARRKLIRAVEDCVLLGVQANQRFLADLLRHPRFASGQATTAFIESDFPSNSAEEPPSATERAIAAALLFHTAAVREGARPGLAGWSNGEPTPERLSLRQGEQRFDLQLEIRAAGAQPRLSVRDGEGHTALQVLEADGRWATLEIDGVRRRLAYHQVADHLWLYGRSGALEFIDITRQPVDGRRSVGSGTLTAPMDGAIVEVRVSEGAQVTQGELLLVLEAMKMEHPLKAGLDGIVRRVAVKAGDQVKGRQVLLEVEPLET